MFQVSRCLVCRNDVYVVDDGDGAYLKCAECDFICDLVETDQRLRGLHASYLLDRVEGTSALVTLVSC